MATKHALKPESFDEVCEATDTRQAEQVPKRQCIFQLTFCRHGTLAICHLRPRSTRKLCFHAVGRSEQKGTMLLGLTSRLVMGK